MGLFKKSKPGKTVDLTVTGMTCGHCEMRVKMALEKVQGVKKVKADNTKDMAVVTYEGEPDIDAMVAAVKEAGYEAHPPM
jgi:copper chaperone CopZ